METKELISESLETIKSYIPNLMNACIEIADFLRANKQTDALQLIVQFATGMEWMTQATTLLNQLEVAVDIEELMKVNNFLNEINEAISIEDYVLVADLFEYEINPSLSTVQQAL
ncbi:hypothetical protein [Niallia sp. 01092]|uniref:hypothetical protein n=1 Tax=unclassified Niallia TaxID=2837522 RepID=UPI003FD4AC33